MLAVFDLDHTILDGDSDSNWLFFLAEQDIVSKEEVVERNKKFYQDYKAGKLNYNEYADFAFGVLSCIPLKRLETLRRIYFKERILPMIRPLAVKCIRKHRKLGHTIIISTATNEFICEPAGKYLKADCVLATRLERGEKGFTGKYYGTPNFREGKITNLLNWLEENHEYQLATTYFYSDSINDLPLLTKVGYPRVVNGDAPLLSEAKKRGWESISFTS